VQTRIAFDTLICGEAGLEVRLYICRILRAAEDPDSRIPVHTTSTGI
jgi:hypothetical protein